jgi:hypothetical protein
MKDENIEARCGECGKTFWGGKLDDSWQELSGLTNERDGWYRQEHSHFNLHRKSKILSGTSVAPGVGLEPTSPEGHQLARP